MHLTHQVDRKVVEGSAVAQQIALMRNGRQRAGDRNAGQQGLHEIARLEHLFAGLGVIGGHAVVIFPEVFHLGVAPQQFLGRGVNDAA